MKTLVGILSFLFLSATIIDCDGKQSTTSSGILPKVLNPLNWIPIIPDVPWNPDSELTTPEIVVRHGYPAETHTVQTKDGYLLNLHRIPCGRAGCGDGLRQPVFLQHGILASSADWILSGPEKGIGFILADLGYDVWLSNLRGNTYSRHHTQMSNNDKEFWDFSFHEMAIFDIPAEIDFIYEHRKRTMGDVSDSDLIYVGHSMGTTALFAMLSEMPEYNERIKLFIALAPVAFMSHIKSPLRLLAPFSKDIEKIMKFFGQNEFLPQNKIIKWLSKYGCEMNEVERYICENTLFVIAGFDKEQYNSTLASVIFAHSPAGTSTKTVVHYAQEIHENGNFQNFDYGREENERRYGTEEPPQYNLSNVAVPTALFYAQNDWLAGYQDVKKLYSNLPTQSAIDFYKIPFDSFNHVDFLWGIDARELVYNKMIDLMRNYK